MSTGTTTNNQNLITFFSGATTSSNSSTINVPFNKGVLKAWGTWGGATVALFCGTPLGTGASIQLRDLADNLVNLTSDTAITIDNIVWNDSLYASITDATGTTDLFVTLQRV